MVLLQGNQSVVRRRKRLLYPLQERRSFLRAWLKVPGIPVEFAERLLVVVFVHRALRRRSPMQLILADDSQQARPTRLKIHPDFKHVNLYHHLLGDTTWWKGTMGIDLPCRGRPYFADDGEPPPDVGQIA